MILLSKGEKRAFDELYKRYSKKITYYFFKMLYQDKEKAEDFTHDLFLKLIEKPECFDVTKKFSNWIYFVASNMCKNEYRRNASKDRNVKDLDLNKVLNNETCISISLENKDFLKNLNYELMKMDEEFALTFILKYQENLSIKEISEILNCPEGTVKSRLFNIILKLSERLKIFNPKFELVENGR